MNYFSNTPVGRFRFIAVLEGISYLILLFIAMPLKYFFEMPSVVTYTGWVHGVLFMLFLLTLTGAASNQNWSFGKSFVAFLTSLIPFATFPLERRLYKAGKARMVSGESATVDSELV